MESSNCGHSDNRLLKEIDHSGCLALYNFNILDEASNDGLPGNSELLNALDLSGNDLPNNASLADADAN